MSERRTARQVRRIKASIERRTGFLFGYMRTTAPPVPPGTLYVRVGRGEGLCLFECGTRNAFVYLDLRKP